jgi:hypothetical protein
MYGESPDGKILLYTGRGTVDAMRISDGAALNLVKVKGQVGMPFWHWDAQGDQP